MAKRLGDQIREARNDRGLTQAQLAAKLGVARETVGNWETGMSTPRSHMRALARELGLTVDGEIVGPPTDDAGVLLDLPPDALADLSPLEREEAIAAAKATLLERAREIRRRVDGR